VSGGAEPTGVGTELSSTNATTIPPAPATTARREAPRRR
jgi:hypothetical protein